MQVPIIVGSIIGKLKEAYSFYCIIVIASIATLEANSFFLSNDLFYFSIMNQDGELL